MGSGDQEYQLPLGNLDPGGGNTDPSSRPPGEASPAGLVLSELPGAHPPSFQEKLNMKKLMLSPAPGF